MKKRKRLLFRLRLLLVCCSYCCVCCSAATASAAVAAAVVGVLFKVVEMARLSAAWRPHRLRAHAATPWFPVVVALLTCANTFALVLSAPLAGLVVAGALARPAWPARAAAALANAGGAAAGVALLIAVQRAMPENFPHFELAAWPRTRAVVADYGVLGCLVYSW